MNKTSNGYNPMRWDCKLQGCFNIVKRPKIELFAECFPGRINFGDCDAIVEINGRVLIQEWKQYPISLSTGQSLMFERISVGKHISVQCIAGDASNMTISHRAWYIDGVWYPWESCTIDDVKAEIRDWVKFAQSNTSTWDLLRDRLDLLDV